MFYHSKIFFYKSTHTHSDKPMRLAKTMTTTTPVFMKFTVWWKAESLTCYPLSSTQAIIGSPWKAGNRSQNIFPKGFLMHFFAETIVQLRPVYISFWTLARVSGLWTDSSFKFILCTKVPVLTNLPLQLHYVFVFGVLSEHCYLIVSAVPWNSPFFF